jgi:hypothetical protein
MPAPLTMPVLFLASSLMHLDYDLPQINVSVFPFFLAKIVPESCPQLIVEHRRFAPAAYRCLQHPADLADLILCSP